MSILKDKSSLGLVIIAGIIMSVIFSCYGCSGVQKQDPKEQFSGDWYIYSMSENGEETSHEDILTMKSFGLDVSLNLNSEDNKATIDLFGEDMAGTWSLDSDNHGNIIIDEQTIDMSIDGDKLSLKQNDSILNFTREHETPTPNDKQTLVAEDGADVSSTQNDSQSNGQ